MIAGAGGDQRRIMPSQVRKSDLALVSNVFLQIKGAMEVHRKHLFGGNLAQDRAARLLSKKSIANEVALIDPASSNEKS
jgi:hypothetical protein